MTVFLVYLVPVLIILVLYLSVRRISETHGRKVFERSQRDGLLEPNSLHPLIDAGRCMGCAACVKACPEGNVLAVLNGNAQLVKGSNCIGHGACQRACPFDAIELVFGTERRGIDIPSVNSEFQTNVPGLYVAGELGGMGLVANAVEQGVQSIENIARVLKGSAGGADCELVIIGAGPAGIAASLMAKKLGINFQTLEQDTLGGTVAHFPRHKIVMTRPVKLPLYGSLRFNRIEKEQLVGIWQQVIDSTGIEPRFGVRVTGIQQTPDGFTIGCENGEKLKSDCVLLAIGRRGSPRRLGVPGEQLAKVLYRLSEPEQYAHSRCLVVGGGDTAVECAMALKEQPGTEVTLSYRGDSVNRAKPANREALSVAVSAGEIDVLWNSEVKEISESNVVVDTADGQRVIQNDWVLVNVGGVLPTQFLKSAGVRVDRWYGRRREAV